MILILYSTTSCLYKCMFSSKQRAILILQSLYHNGAKTLLLLSTTYTRRFPFFPSPDSSVPASYQAVQCIEVFPFFPTTTCWVFCTLMVCERILSLYELTPSFSLCTLGIHASLVYTCISCFSSVSIIMLI